MSDVTRRERLRQELLDQVRSVARRQLRDGGLPGVSLRAIAREVGMGPASLYNYFEGVDAIVTDLLVESYTQLGEHVASAAAGGRGAVGARLVRAMLAYRQWAIGHPEEFRLLYGSPLGGYEAPADGPTVEAASSVTRPFAGLLVDGWASGALATPTGGPRAPRELREGMTTLVGEPDRPFTDAEVWTAFDAWSHFHGLVVLELNGHFVPGFDYSAFYESRVRGIVEGLVAGR